MAIQEFEFYETDGETTPWTHGELTQELIEDPSRLDREMDAYSPGAWMNSPSLNALKGAPDWSDDGSLDEAFATWSPGSHPSAPASERNFLSHDWATATTFTHSVGNQDTIDSDTSSLGIACISGDDIPEPQWLDLGAIAQGSNAADEINAAYLHGPIDVGTIAARMPSHSFDSDVDTPSTSEVSGDAQSGNGSVDRTSNGFGTVTPSTQSRPSSWVSREVIGEIGHVDVNDAEPVATQIPVHDIAPINAEVSLESVVPPSPLEVPQVVQPRRKMTRRKSNPSRSATVGDSDDPWLALVVPRNPESSTTPATQSSSPDDPWLSLVAPAEAPAEALAEAPTGVPAEAPADEQIATSENPDIAAHISLDVEEPFPAEGDLSPIQELLMKIESRSAAAVEIDNVETNIEDVDSDPIEQEETAEIESAMRDDGSLHAAGEPSGSTVEFESDEYQAMPPEEPIYIVSSSTYMVEFTNPYTVVVDEVDEFEPEYFSNIPGDGAEESTVDLEYPSPSDLFDLVISPDQDGETEIHFVKSPYPPQIVGQQYVQSFSPPLPLSAYPPPVSHYQTPQYTPPQYAQPQYAAAQYVPPQYATPQYAPPQYDAHANGDAHGSDTPTPEYQGWGYSIGCDILPASTGRSRRKRT